VIREIRKDRKKKYFAGKSKEIVKKIFMIWKFWTLYFRLACVRKTKRERSRVGVIFLFKNVAICPVKNREKLGNFLFLEYR